MTATDVHPLPLPDRRAREAISRDLDVNMLVEAGAGSGKTTELVRRMSALLESGTAEIDEIAAVTFTRKAAGELRERFQAAIEERLQHLRSTESADDLEVERLGRALDDIDRAFIGTIHAFCARLLRERPLEVGLDPGFEELAVEERLVLRRRFWHGYLERLARDSDPVLEDLAEAGLRPVSLYGLFERLVENPDVVFEAVESDPPPLSDVAPIRAELEGIVDQGGTLMPEREPDRGWDSLQTKLRKVRFSREIKGWEKPADLYDAVAQLCKPGPRGHQITQNRWKNKELAKAFREKVNAFGVGDTPARRLLGRWYAHRYALAVRLADHAAREFAEHRMRLGKIDFQDLLSLTARLLRKNERVRRDLGSRYRRLLVDEFQDTDPLQAEIVLLLASEPEEAEGADDAEAGADSEKGSSPDSEARAGPAVDAGLAPPGEVPPSSEPVEDAAHVGSGPEWLRAVPRPGALFVVGDPKQSIYRFRRADIQLYGLVKERFREFGGVVELTTNFRSRPRIGDLVNQVFDHSDFFPAEESAEQAGFEPLNTRPPDRDVPAEGVFVYRLSPEESSQISAASDDASRLAAWIRRRVDAGEREPGDFMILTRNRARLDIYARALEAHSVPVQVTGAGVGAEEEIRELEVLLQCLIDPSNPVAVVAVLVGLFFGLDYEMLVQHRLEGGDFDAMRPGDRGHPDVLAAVGQLHEWWTRATDQPADIFVTGLVAELGLLPFAGAGELGSLRAGAMVYALDAVRAAAVAGEASLPGALAAVGAALDLAEAEAPLEPGRPDVVRLMNLHQAKGLEAPVVVLADPAGARRRDPDVHVVRTGGGRALGYAQVIEVGEGYRSDQVLAEPDGWKQKAEAEVSFEIAEEVRLLYVAVTRAKEELLVVRRDDDREGSPWAALHPWLDEHAVALDLERGEPGPRPRVELAPEDARTTAAAAASRVARLSDPSYLHASVTQLAKGSPEKVESPGASPAPDASAEGFRGFSWGSAVHGALALAATAPDAAALRAACKDLLVQNERPLDDHGEPTELEELVELVRTVRSSSLWERADAAERVLSEVPFALPGIGVDAVEAAGQERTGRARPQLDLFGDPTEKADKESVAEGAGASAKSVTTAVDEVTGGDRTGDPLEVLEGVIDLAFLEPDGWVIADYKTDVGTDPDFSRRLANYRRQVDLYAEAWTRLTGTAVKERVLFFTSQGRVERW